MNGEFSHLIETLELAMDGCAELEKAQIEGLRWTREKWIERRHNIQAMIEQAIDEALNLALAFGS